MNLIQFIESETRRTGKSPDTTQLRTVIESKKQSFNVFLDELDDLYEKTFQYEEMQRVIAAQKGRVIYE